MQRLLTNKVSREFNRQNSRVSFGTFLFEAARQGDWQNLQLILDQKGAVDHIDHTDKYGQTPLTMAASNGHLRCIKLLLMYKCDLYRHVSIDGQDVYAWDLATRNGHTEVAKYLQGCVDDLVKFTYHRATMEADVYEICQTSQGPSSDLCEFEDLLNKLVNHCGYDVNGGDEDAPPLLIVAARSDNGPIVQSLLEKFDATPYSNDPITGESVLHIACRAMSPLRFYIMKKCPQLLMTVDIKGSSPLHDACIQNDVEFFSWLFQEQLKYRSGSPSSIPFSLSSSFTFPDKLPTSPLHLIQEEEVNEDDELTFKYGTSPLDESTIQSVYRRLFAVAVNAQSMLHVAAKQGHTALLDVILQAAKSLGESPEGGDLQVLVRRESSSTPIDKAIAHSQPECLRLLLDYALGISSVSEKVIDDNTLLSKAVSLGDLPVLCVLLEQGLWAGLQSAIAVAVQKDHTEILRVLMFYYTQVMCVTKCTQVKRSGQLRLISGTASWDQLGVSELDPSWLNDSILAINSVYLVLKCLSITKPVHQHPELFKNLGSQCVQYFQKCVWVSAPPALSSSVPLYLTELDISGNQLQCVPPELFQQATLEVLKLSNNAIDALPSSLNFQDPLYTCTGLRRLDISHNKLHTLPEDLFVCCGLTIEELNARNNQIDSLPPSLWICPHLQTLDLAHNQLTQLHYFSDPKLFYDQPFSQMLIRAIRVEGGSPLQQSFTSDEDFAYILNYITRLNLFYQTAKAFFPEVFEGTKPTEHLVQHVVDIHWLRSKLSRDHTVDIWDVQLHADDMCSLTVLNLSYNKFVKFPWDLACVAPNLQKLDFRENPGVESMDIIHDIPATTASLIMTSCSFTNVSSKRPEHPCASPVKLLAGYLTDPRYCKHCSHPCLSQLSNLVLDNNKLASFPILVSTKSQGDTDAAPQVLYPSLSVLSLSKNNLPAVPDGIHHINQLSSLSLSYNTAITKLPPSLGLVNHQVMLVLKLEGLFIKNIPAHMLEKSRAKPILSYLKSLYQKSQPYYRIKLMLVGNCNKGKTSLLLNLTRKGKITRFKEVEMGLNKQPLSTVGVDLGDWEYTPTRKPKVTFMTWDFGGQEEYYATHQCFLTQRSLYLLVWSARDGELGLSELKVWMENIGSRIPGAPVIVVATHADLLPSNRRNDIIRQLNKMFKDLYLSRRHNHHAYPDVHHKCYFVSCNDGYQISTLRDAVYDVAMSIRAQGSRKADDEMMLKQPVPASYIKLQDIVRELAHTCAAEYRVPIFSAKEYRAAVWSMEFPEKLDELDLATNFLHENGILLHYDDPSLSDLYFLDPQWLGSMLSCVVTVQEKNPFQKNGFMEVSALSQVLRNDQFPPSVMTQFIPDFISLMQKFEVVLLLDKERLLIPSLLPSSEENTCVVLPSTTVIETSEVDLHTLQDLSRQPFAGISSLAMRIIGRFYLLPFVPNGFFPHLIARIISSKITAYFLRSLLTSSITDQLSVFNNLHWRCWRGGIMLLWRHMEIFRIAPTTLPPPGVDNMVVMSSSGRTELKQDQKALEIKVACLPEQQLVHNEYLPDDPSRSRSDMLATWLLQQATEIIDSVFNDWYEPFTRRKGFDMSAVEQVCPCVECLHCSLTNQYKLQTSIIVQKTPVDEEYDVIDHFSWKHFFLFSSPYCVFMASRGSTLSCPQHGEVTVDLIAPDLAFYDLPASMLFHDPADVTMSDQPLGSGGFGSVYAGKITTKGRSVDVAIKQFAVPTLIGRSSSDSQQTILYSDVEEELAAWDVYMNGSRESRVMYQLQHPNILGLVGLAFQPLRLLLELAPRGDLKHCLKEYKEQNMKLSRRTLKTVMLQLADALSYIHGKHIIYRDLKPGNVLVWEFPAPRAQWRQDATVRLKLADYGISKMFNADGVRGTEGTPAYLPPEVILRSEAFTTKLDSYSFGMFLYYLFTMNGPFEKEKGRPISALLEEGRRPQVSMKDRPAALQMFELMCWCWSDKPQHRPDFTQISSTITSSTFTRLLGASQIMERDSFTCVCLHTFTPQIPYVRSSEEQLTGSLKRASATPSPAILSLFVEAAAHDEESVLQVWYGTKNGQLGHVQFTLKETSTEEVIKLDAQINTICVANRMIWVGTKGEGLKVFNPAVPKLVAVWREKDGAVVHKLLPVKESSLVFALTNIGIVVFEGIVPHADAVITLVPCTSHAYSDILTTGVVAPNRGEQEDTLLWCCSSSGQKFKVFDGMDSHMHGVKEVSIPNLNPQSERQTRHIECCELPREHRIALADRNFVMMWSVTTMKMVNNVDCSKCHKTYGNETQKSVVTSLLAVKEKLYIGTMGGVILVLQTSSLDVLHYLHGHDNPVRCLQAINRAPQIRRFSRMYSRHDSKNPTSPLLSEMTSITSLSSSSENESTDRDLVLSFSQGYRGVVGDSQNYPPMFNLPSDSILYCSVCCRANCNCREMKIRQPKPNPEIGCLLYWSSEEQTLFSEDTASEQIQELEKPQTRTPPSSPSHIQS